MKNRAMESAPISWSQYTQLLILEAKTLVFIRYILANIIAYWQLDSRSRFTTRLSRMRRWSMLSWTVVESPHGSDRYLAEIVKLEANSPETASTGIFY